MASQSRNKAFSLLEIAIVLSIIGVVTAGGLVMLTASTQTKLYNETVARMEIINKAIADYAYVFGKLPCPASLTLLPTDANYGVEAASNTNTCVGGTPAASFASATGTVEGAIPVSTLRLPLAYMYDAWGHKFRYAINPDKTADASYPPVSGTQCTSTKAIRINDATGAARTTNADYALISHGADGHGSYSRNGTVFSNSSTNTDQLKNCHCDATGAATTYDGIYVQKLPTTDVADNTNAFDDIVTYREGWQMQNNSSALSSNTSCNKFIYVGDYYNNRIQKFDMSGNYVSSINYSQIPNDLTTDSSGNLIVLLTGSGASGCCYSDVIEKYDSTGTLSWQKTFTTGSANGQSSSFQSIAVDSAGNIWVSDKGNYRIQKFDSTGNWLASMGGPSPHSCVASPAGSVPACAPGTGNGQFQQYSEYPMAVDASDNLLTLEGEHFYIDQFTSAGTFTSRTSTFCYGWGDGCVGNWPSCLVRDNSGNYFICDPANSRVQKWDSTYNYLLKFGTNGSGNGQFNYVYGMALALDSNGNIYVTDWANNRVQKFDSSGNYVSQFGTAGSANGEFNGPVSIAIANR